MTRILFRCLSVSVICLILSNVALLATTFYVRPDGDNSCSGLSNTSYNPGDPNSPCAFKTVFYAESQLSSGDTLKLYTTGVEGTLYKEQVTFHDPNITVTSIGVGGAGFARIGILEQYTGGWNSDGNTYTRTFTDNSVWAAYIDFKNMSPSKPYEHERMTLMPHQFLGDLRADPNGYLDPNGVADPNNRAYYIGPGFHLDLSNDLLHVRLQETPQVASYRQKYLNLGFNTDTNPNNYKILVSSSNFSVRLQASGITLRNLVIEPAKESLQLCNADNAVIDNVTVWGSFDYAIRDSCASDNVTIKNSSILNDIPYWISWGDCKHPEGPCEESNFGAYGRGTAIEPDNNASGWTLDHNLIRGGHDGFSYDDPNEGGSNMTISYNVFADFADDPFELEGTAVGRHEIYGNFITNSLVCLAVGQGSPSIVGPIYFYSNICSLARVPFIERSGDNCTACQASFNGNREYGNEFAFKIESDLGDKKLNLHIYNNTVFLADSHPSAGMAILRDAVRGSMKNAEVFNNIFMKVNGRVGQGSSDPNSVYAYPDSNSIDPNTVDYNLYRKLNNDSSYLTDLSYTVGDGTPVCMKGWECHSIGDANSIGTDPDFHDERSTTSQYEGIGCLDGTCGGFDHNVSSRWRFKPGAEFIEPAMFIPESNSPSCGTGRGAGSWPKYDTDPNDPDPNTLVDYPNHHVVDPTATLSKNQIGAVPCNYSLGGYWDLFPFGAIWTSGLVSGVVPTPSITSITCPGTTVPVGNSLNLCGTKSDTDGGPPYEYVWDFDNPSSCPSDLSVLCPGSVTFSTVGTCNLTLKVKDRWGLEGSTANCPISVTTGGGGGGCSDCSRCICEQY